MCQAAKCLFRKIIVKISVVEWYSYLLDYPRDTQFVSSGAGIAL